MQNPYTHRSTIHDPSMFFGRSAELARLYALLGNTQSISIVGDRRIGKSSLLYSLALPEVQARVNGPDFTKYVFVFIDLQGSVYRNAAEFLDHLLDKLQQQTAAVGKLTTDPTTVRQDAFETAVAEVNKRGFKLIFLLDEFDYVTRNEQLDAALFSFLRYMATNYDLALITASQRPLAQLCHTDIVDSPFFNIFARVTLEALTWEEARQLIITPSLKAGYALEEDANWVLTLTGSQPIFVQIACFYLLEAKRRLPDNEFVDYDAVGRLFYEEARDHFEYAWTHLSDHSRQNLEKEIWQDQGPYQHYLAASSAFRRFIRQQRGWQTSKEEFITAETVETALKNLWKIAELGQGPLTRLNLVKQRLVQSGLAPIEPNLGRALQEILRSAIEHLGAAHQADKTSKQWRQHFILDQCYVEGAQNKNIIIRLNVAERTFYRERTAAIKALAQVLQAMEMNTLGSSTI